MKSGVMKVFDVTHVLPGLIPSIVPFTAAKMPSVRARSIPNWSVAVSSVPSLWL
jgi:hypothetical protein